jgi:hypothetical protein
MKTYSDDIITPDAHKQSMEQASELIIQQTTKQIQPLVNWVYASFVLNLVLLITFVYLIIKF